MRAKINTHGAYPSTGGLVQRPQGASPRSRPQRPSHRCCYLLASVCVALLGLALGAAPALAFDVAVGEIHVTQGIQHIDPTFWVPLVAERSTAVRVYVRCVTGTPGPVTGTVKVFVDGQEITPPGGVSDLNQQFPNANGQFIPTCGRISDVWDFEEDMLTFELPAPNGITPAGSQLQSNNVFFQVEIAAQGDADPNNNVGWTSNLTVVRRGVPRLYKLPVSYRPNGQPPQGSEAPEPLFIAPGVGDAMAPAVFPISDADPYPPGQGEYWDNHTFPPLLPGLTFEIDCNGNGLIDVVLGPPMTSCRSAMVPAILRASFPLYLREADVLVAYLLARRFLVVEHGVGDQLTFLYGWVADGNLIDHDGYGITGGPNVGYGVDRPERGQMVFAHEFGHMIDLDHVPDPGLLDVGEYGWDVGARLHDNPNPMPPGLSGRIKPASEGFKSLLAESPPVTTARAWIDPDSYVLALNNPRLAAAPSSLCERVKCREFETLMVYGVPGLDSTLRTRVGATVFRYPWYTESPVKAERANVVVILHVQEPGTTTVKTMRVPIEARGIITPSDGEHREVEPAPFAVAVPVPQGTKLGSLRIEDVAGTLLSDEISPTASTPTVAIVHPKPSATLGAETTMVWTAGDKDAGAVLTYQVAYSPNDGLNFIPVAVALEQTSLTIDARILPKTESGRGLLRVFVNDGFNTSYTDVKGLSIAR